jgi:hypothetical protein
MDNVQAPTNSEHKTKIRTAVKVSHGHLEDGDNQLITTTRILLKIKQYHDPRDVVATDINEGLKWMFHFR